MACILHIGQKVENFQAFESPHERYQNAKSVQFYKRDRSVAKAQVRISYKLSERLKYCEVTFRCIHGDKNFKSRGNLSIHVIYVFIKALQIKTRREFELRLSTSVHLLENLKQNNLTFSKTCAFLYACKADM